MGAREELSWMARATTSLPVPDSPRMSTVAVVGRHLLDEAVDAADDCMELTGWQEIVGRGPGVTRILVGHRCSNWHSPLPGVQRDYSLCYGKHCGISITNGNRERSSHFSQSSLVAGFTRSGHLLAMTSGNTAAASARAAAAGIRSRNFGRSSRHPCFAVGDLGIQIEGLHQRAAQSDMQHAPACPTRGGTPRSLPGRARAH